jgi:exopolyphosphatase/pppGpp-phosphohydrolase
LRDAGSNNIDRKNQAVQPTETDIPLSKLAALNAQLANMDMAQRRALPGITSQRSEIIIAGSLILEEAMRALGINVIRTCDWSLREGVIIDSLREVKTNHDPRRILPIKNSGLCMRSAGALVTRRVTHARLRNLLRRFLTVSRPRRIFRGISARS